MKQPISVTIITKNEERNIERCLRSVSWADEIIVVDSGSTDRTVEICNQFRCRVLQTEWRGYGLTKHFAVEQASHDWIFSIDADEEATVQLHGEIERILENPDAAGYRIKRNSFYLRKMIRHAGWNKDYPLRLFNRKYGNFNDKVLHESVQLSGNVKKIEAPILHYTYPTIHSHVARMNKYSELGAEAALSKGKSATLAGAVARGMIKFLKMYFLQAGFLDGKIGFLLAFNSSYGVFLKYCKLWEKTR